MRIYRRVSRSSREILVLSVRNVLVSLCVSVFLGQSVVDDVHDVGLFAQTDQEIVRLYVAMDVVL